MTLGYEVKATQSDATENYRRGYRGGKCGRERRNLLYWIRAICRVNSRKTGRNRARFIEARVSPFQSTRDRPKRMFITN